jgi:serine/threonine protein phosphatase PrpC
MLRAADTIWKTDTGRQRRDNEDNAFVRAPLFVVADGMGGAQAGEVASAIAVEEFHQPLPDEGPAEERLSTRIRAANRRIYELSRIEHEHAGMGTTLTAVYVDDSDLAVAHVGDSRAYIFRDGQLARLTQDHSLVEELVRQGKLTEAQAAEHPQRSIITRALGIELEVEVDTWTYPVRAGDVVLLCSDGLTSMIGESQIAAILGSETDLAAAAERLIAAANDAGGRDNITVVLFRLEDVDGGAVADQPTIVGMEPADGSHDDGEAPVDRTAEASTSGRAGATLTAPVPSVARRRTSPPLARTQGRSDRPGRGSGRRRPRRFAKPVAALIAVVIVLFLFGGGSYLASRELFFIGTNPDGIVTLYRGLPYDLPLGVKLYEQVYVSGVPVSAVPTDRRRQLLNHQLRSQADAISLVHAAELGQISR